MAAGEADRRAARRVPAGVRAGCCSLALPVLSVSCITINEGNDKLGGQCFFYGTVAFLHVDNTDVVLYFIAECRALTISF